MTETTRNKNTLRDRLRERRRLSAVWRFLTHYVGGVINRASDRHLFLISGGLAFSLMVCLIPLALIVFAVLGMFLERPAVSKEIAAFIDRVIPYRQYADFVRQLVFDRIHDFTLYRTWAGLIGLVGLLFAASGLFGSMRTILNAVYGGAGGESIILSKLRDLRLVLMVLVYFLLSTAVLPALDALSQYTGGIRILQEARLSLLGEVFFSVVSFVVIFVAFFVIFFFVPTRRPSKGVVTVSALASAVMWVLAKEAFGFYLAHAVNLERIYGAYLLAIAVFFWIYYSAIVFVIGAEIGQLYRERREAVTPPPPTHRFFL